MSVSKVAKKIYKAMSEIDYLQKDGKVAYGNTRYTYISEEKITTELKKAMTKAGLIMYPSKMEILGEKEVETKSGKSRILNILVTYRVQDTDSDEYIEVQAIGEGMDSGDKTVYKAMTGAFKYAQRQTFMIPTGDDPDKISSDELTGTGKEASQKPQAKNQNTETPIKTEYICSECHQKVSYRVADYSKENYGRILCMKCQNLVQSQSKAQGQVAAK